MRAHLVLEWRQSNLRLSTVTLSPPPANSMPGDATFREKKRKGMIRGKSAKAHVGKTVRLRLRGNQLVCSFLFFKPRFFEKAMNLAKNVVNQASVSHLIKPGQAMKMRHLVLTIKMMMEIRAKTTADPPEMDAMHVQFAMVALQCMYSMPCLLWSENLQGVTVLFCTRMHTYVYVHIHVDQNPNTPKTQQGGITGTLFWFMFRGQQESTWVRRLILTHSQVLCVSIYIHRYT